MGSQKPILSAGKPDLVAVILERSVAQQLALALAWALGSTGGGKSQKKGLYAPAAEDVGTGKKPVLGAVPKMAAMPKMAAVPKMAAMPKMAAVPKMAASSAKKAAKKLSAKKAGAKKPGKK